MPRATRTTRASSAKKSRAQLDREIAAALTQSSGRSHATMSEASIWEEVGLEDAPAREKAAFWREQLLNDIDDVDAAGVTSSLRPVLADVSEIVGPDVLHAFKRDKLDSVEPSERRSAIREIREQILNASPGQIVEYANEHYRSL